MSQPGRRVDIYANKDRREIELIGLVDGSKVYDIKWTVEQAINHVKAVIAAVDMVQGKPEAKSSLIMPPGYNS